MNERGIFKEIILFASLLILIASFVASDSAVPQGPNVINVTESGRYFNSSEPYPIEAKAGNVTALTITHTRVTEAWQGYYGNITGTITLDDGVNETMYMWDIPDPKGEIYASNGSSVDWPNVYCMNLSHKRPNNGTGDTTESGVIFYNINMTQIELNFGINLTDKDGLNETFNDTYTSTTGFEVGAVTIDVFDGCSLAHPFQDQGHNTQWKELLLTDNTSLIFTAILEENVDSFKSGDETADFQLMVLENGHVGQEEQVTTYYFYVEIY